MHLSPEIMQSAKKREKQSARRTGRVGVLFLLPALIMVSLFLLTPVVGNVLISMTKWKRFKGLDQFAGAANYEKLFEVPFFGVALLNTGIWVVSALVLPLAIGLGLALYLRNMPFQEGFKSLFFLPKVLAPTAVGTIWYYVYAPRGMLNSLASSVTGNDVSYGWLFEPMSVTPSLITTFVWGHIGITMVLLLLGLAAIPKDPIEAARVEGASNWQVFRHVVWPLLLPTVMVVTILNVAAGFTSFDLIWVMAGDFPGKRSLSLAVYMYFESFSKNSWAFGAAIAVVLSAMVITVSWALAVIQSRIETRIR